MKATGCLIGTVAHKFGNPEFMNKSIGYYNIMRAQQSTEKYLCLEADWRLA